MHMKGIFFLRLWNSVSVQAETWAEIWTFHGQFPNIAVSFKPAKTVFFKDSVHSTSINILKLLLLGMLCSFYHYFSVFLSQDCLFNDQKIPKPSFLQAKLGSMHNVIFLWIAMVRKTTTKCRLNGFKRRSTLESSSHEFSHLSL